MYQKGAWWFLPWMRPVCLHYERLQSASHKGCSVAVNNAWKGQGSGIEAECKMQREEGRREENVREEPHPEIPAEQQRKTIAKHFLGCASILRHNATPCAFNLGSWTMSRRQRVQESIISLSPSEHLLSPMKPLVATSWWTSHPWPSHDWLRLACNRSSWHCVFFGGIVGLFQITNINPRLYAQHFVALRGSYGGMMVSRQFGRKESVDIHTYLSLSA